MLLEFLHRLVEFSICKLSEHLLDAKQQPPTVPSESEGANSIRKSLALQKMLFAKLCALCMVVWVQTFLLQQCVRAESFVFTRALTSAVNEFACGRAPAFLKG